MCSSEHFFAILHFMTSDLSWPVRLKYNEDMSVSICTQKGFQNWHFLKLGMEWIGML